VAESAQLVWAQTGQIALFILAGLAALRMLFSLIGSCSKNKWEALSKGGQK
jgi:hypothetical protein